MLQGYRRQFAADLRKNWLGKCQHAKKTGGFPIILKKNTTARKSRLQRLLLCELQKKQSPMKHFRTFLPALAIVALVATNACTPLKIATVNEEITAIRGNQSAGNFFYEITKKRKNPIEILEVVHIDKATGERKNLSFTLTDTTKKRKLVTLKGETAFIIHAKLLTNGEPQPHAAEIIYRKGADGKRKTIKVKNPQPAQS